MKKLIASFACLGLCFAVCLGGSAVAQTLEILSGEIYTVGEAGDPNEEWGNFIVREGGELVVPEGTTFTADARSDIDGGIVRLQGGDFTLNSRLDQGGSSGGTLLAESGTFRVLDFDNRGTNDDGWKLPDGRPSGGQEAKILIGDAEVYALPALQMIIERNALITFELGGTGSLVLDEIFGSETDGDENPFAWLFQGTLPENEGFGLFAPATEEIVITEIAPQIPEDDPSGIDWRVTSVPILVPSGSLFTWGERVADGSWGNTGGWKKDGVDTTDIPAITQSEVSALADDVQVLSGTLRVNTGDRGAWSLDVDSGATTEVSDGFNLRIRDAVNVDAGGTIEVASGGSLSGEAGLAVAAGGRLELNDGTASFADNAVVAGTVAFTGTGTDAEVIVGDMNGDTDVNFGDLSPFALGLTDIPGYNTAFPDLVDTRVERGDVNLDTSFNFGDLSPFVELLTNPGSGPGTGNPLSALTMGAGTLANVEVTSSGAINNSGEVSVGQLSMQSDSLLQKGSSGVLILDQTGGANSLAAGSRLRINSGTVVALNSTANNALDETTTQLNGGELALSSTGSATAFDSPIVVSSDSTIRATQMGTGALADETVTLGGTNGISASSGIVTLNTDSGYTLNLAGDVSGSGRLDFGDAASVQVNGSVAPAGVGYVGDVSGVSVAGGSVAPTDAYYFNPSGGTPEMTVPFDIDGARDVVIGDLDDNDGSVGFSGALAHTGVTRIERGALRIGGSNNAPTASNIVFNSIGSERSAVVESNESALALTIGTGVGNVSWNQAGGFASSQGGAGTAVTLNGGATLDWDSATNGFNGQPLQLGSATANAPVDFTNDINLGSAVQRDIQVADNSNTVSDIARISGIISSSGGVADILHVNRVDEDPFREGLLELTGNNTFDNSLRLDAGSVFAVDGVGLPTNANLQFSSGDDGQESVLVSNGTFTRNIGNAAGEVFWEGDGGGFAARGGDLTVTLNGGATIVNADATGFNGSALQLGSRYADGVATLTNSLDYGDDDPTVRTFDNPDSANDRFVLDGDIINADGVRFRGTGYVIINGNLDNTGRIRSRAGGTVIINGDQLNLDNGGDLEVLNDSSLFINGTVNVGDDVFFSDNDGGAIGGSGQINMFNGTGNDFVVESNSRLSPGADAESVGKLGVNLGADDTEDGASSFFMQPTSTYNMQFGKDDSNVVHDSLDLTNENTAVLFDGFIALQNEGSTMWTLDVSAVDDLAGMVSSGDEFDVMTFGAGIGLLDYDTEVFDFDDAPLLGGTGQIASAEITSSTGDFNVGTATLNYDTGVGRIYITGLTLAGGASASAIPEPTAFALSILAMAGLLGLRRRK